ncbi:hypothetical protein [Bradyrhizobium sp. CB2312]|uniref:hypothetical protein n=1 Tax=Bradyrhizobium sp. CB2312 TaxID=3039155 RepID=UPI0024B15A16|nr:hypothetical protein [Bradyrhizobium sp. CB2312]WFU71270.1 hypothetical protein QA642_39635 [Bradyrhizobium sp. CB2312]
MTARTTIGSRRRGKWNFARLSKIIRSPASGGYRPGRLTAPEAKRDRKRPITLDQARKIDERTAVRGRRRTTGRRDLSARCSGLKDFN